MFHTSLCSQYYTFNKPNIVELDLLKG